MAAADTLPAPAFVLQRGVIPDAARGVDILELSMLTNPASAAAGYLDLEVTHLGDANSRAFEAYWDGTWIETSPPGITIVLGHRSTGGEQQSAAKTIVSIDVGIALSERPNLWAMVVADATMSPAVELHLDANTR